MIFNLFHKLNLWKTLDSKDRIVRILVLGFIIYTIIYVSLLSSFTKQKFDVTGYIHYLYYIISIDFTSTVYKFYPFQEKRKKIKCKSKKMLTVVKPKNNLPNDGKNNVPNNSESDDELTIPLYVSKNNNG